MGKPWFLCVLAGFGCGATLTQENLDPERSRATPPHEAETSELRSHLERYQKQMAALRSQFETEKRESAAYQAQMQSALERLVKAEEVETSNRKEVLEARCETERQANRAANAERAATEAAKPRKKPPSPERIARFCKFFSEDALYASAVRTYATSWMIKITPATIPTVQCRPGTPSDVEEEAYAMVAMPTLVHDLSDRVAIVLPSAGPPTGPCADLTAFRKAHETISKTYRAAP